MIHYRPSAFCVWLSGCDAIRFVLVQRSLRMSVAISMAAGLVGAAIKTLDDYFRFLQLIMPDKFVYSSFFTVLGFLLVFRSAQSYSRYTEGATLTHMMSADFLDAASLLISLSRASKAARSELREFHRMVVRLFSSLNAVCIGDLSETDMDRDVFWTEGILDLAGLDDVTVGAIQNSACKPECVSQRIQALVTDRLDNILQGVPAPLLTRVFQELGAGMIRYHEAMKLVHVPFPFAYVAVTEALLCFQTVYTPFMVALLTRGPFGACAFSFSLNFLFWTLYGLSGEFDNPFGTSVNNLDLQSLQDSTNLRLVALLQHALAPPSALTVDAADEVEVLDGAVARHAKPTMSRTLTMTKRATVHTKPRCLEHQLTALRSKGNDSPSHVPSMLTREPSSLLGCPTKSEPESGPHPCELVAGRVVGCTEGSSPESAGVRNMESDIQGRASLACAVSPGSQQAGGVHHRPRSEKGPVRFDAGAELVRHEALAQERDQMPRRHQKIGTGQRPLNLATSRFATGRRSLCWSWPPRPVASMGCRTRPSYERFSSRSMGVSAWSSPAIFPSSSSRRLRDA